MYHSIQQYLTEDLPQIEQEISTFYQKPETFAHFARTVKESMLQLGCRILAEELQLMDQAIRSSQWRKREWSIVRKDQTSLLTSVGMVRYEKTLFQNKETEESAYLLDRLLKQKPHERMTADAEAELYEEAVQSSYQKSGAECVPGQLVSRETVKNKIHALEFPKEEAEAEKKRVKRLYVDADEDHIALQFLEEKGDVKRSEKGHKNNGCLVKLVYVYEGSEEESETNHRRRLNNVHYLGGIYEGRKGNQELWEEVNAYIESHYELEEDGHILINGDGGSWIRRGKEVLGKQAVLLLDGFHQEKYIRKASGHMGEQKEAIREQMKQAAREADRKEMEKLFETLEQEATTEEVKKRVETGKRYLLENWERIRQGKRYEKERHGCSAEGHVSHRLSARMSSRPMGWSKRGADRMGRLRLYAANGGDMLKLAEYQRSRVREPKQPEESWCSAEAILRSEKQAKKELERNYDRIQKSLGSAQMKRMVGIMLRVGNL